MILHKLANAIRRQDWFQVVIEVLIVIVGIYLGLQATDWNNEREERVEEAQYLNQLHSDLVEAIEGASPLIVISEDKLLGLREASEIVSGKVQKEALSMSQCNAIYAAHIYLDRGFSLPTIVELISTGQLSNIQNDTVKQMITKYNINVMFWESLKDATQIGSINFSDKYPNLIEIDENMLTMARNLEEVNALNHICHLELMKNSRAFRNNLTDAGARVNGFTNNLRAHLNELNIFHEMIDQELGIVHKEADL